MSRFVSAGTHEDPPERSDEWLAAQQELDANRARREQEARQDTGKSLYETLQANKAAKQEAFEESIRLKNQFRSLDEDEVDFLDSVLESTRAQEAAVQKENSEQLQIFRRQREEAEAAALAEQNSVESMPNEEEQWTFPGRKRKKGRDRESVLGVKLRKTSSAASDAKNTPILPVKTASSSGVTQSQSEPSESVVKASEIETVDDRRHQPGKAVDKAADKAADKVVSTGLGLVAYSSDDED